MVLQAYVDDSGDSGKPPAYVLAGFIGHLEQWAEFSVRWDALLNVSPKLDYVKMSEAAALSGQFRGWTESERDERLLKFVALIESHYVFGFSSVVPVDAWNDIMRGKAPADFKNIYYLNFFSLIMSLSKTPWIRELGSRIEFIFDESGVLGDRVQAKWTTFYEASWHECFRRMQLCGLPIVNALKGPVVGGGLELALVGHVRVADRTSYYALPEVKHGFFVGGGASVRASRVIGASRVTEMMITSRVYDAEDGYRLGISHYLVDDGKAEALAVELAQKAASNTQESNFAITVALPHIEDMSSDNGYFTEALMEGVIQASPGLIPRLKAFLQGRHKTKIEQSRAS